MSRTPLDAVHRGLGARVVDFHGWEMPLFYADIRSEHLAVRRQVGLFDLSHMGRLAVRGPGAAAFLDGLVTQAVAGMPERRCRYGFLLNERGGVLDDILVYREPGGFLLVVNASNRPKVTAWLEGRLPASGVVIEDRTAAVALLAVQGPRALDLLRAVTDADLAAMKYYTFGYAKVDGTPSLVSRTGYTGEDGFEIYLPAESAVPCWQALMAVGSKHGLVPVGLGARDTLRLEAGMPLYGHELDEDTTPVEAGLEWAVAFSKPFAGREALERQRAGGPRRRLVGLEVSDKRIPRQGYPVRKAGRPVGAVTSGTASPLTGKTIAMAYVAPAEAAPGNALEVEIRGTGYPARVVPLPFYKRERPAKTGA